MKFSKAEVEAVALATQRDVLLPELVSGEVKVRDFTARGVVI